jgi:ABC-type ATPase involved in cell division
MIKFENVSKKFGDDMEVVKSLNLEINRENCWYLSDLAAVAKPLQ